MKSARMTARLDLVLDQELKDRVSEMAEVTGMAMSEFVRQTLANVSPNRLVLADEELEAIARKMRGERQDGNRGRAVLAGVERRICRAAECRRKSIAIGLLIFDTCPECGYETREVLTECPRCGNAVQPEET